MKKVNEAIIEYLSQIFEIAKADIVLLKGGNSKYKRFEFFADDEDIQSVINRYK